jgi:hypothetical protein
MGDALTPVKICTRCGTEKPVTPEFFYRDCAQRAGLSSQCKQCVSKARRARRPGNAKAIAAKRKAYNQAHAEHHIRPVSSFTFTSADDTEVKACWALTNLRPLWKRDNLTKHARRTHLI